MNSIYGLLRQVNMNGLTDIDGAYLDGQRNLSTHFADMRATMPYPRMKDARREWRRSHPVGG